MKHPEWNIYFSTLTNTGMKVAKEKIKNADNIFFVPFDFRHVVQKFFRALNPQIFVLAESEFWPNLLRKAQKMTKGVLLINGRISTLSYKRYRKFKFFSKKILKNINIFLVQTERDKENFRNIGVSPHLIKVAGNLKSEVDLPLLNDNEISNLKKGLGIAKGKKVIIAGSTRKGEEKILLDAFSEARKKRDDLLFIIAPRHIERCDEIKKICEDFSFEVMRRTLVSPDSQWDVLILDTIGELAQFYALSDVAFIGGSLVSWGGHNLLEPAFYSKPIFFGPHMKNFAFLAEKFIQSDAAKVIQEESELVRMFLSEDEKLLQETGRKAKETLNSLQGTTEKILETIENFLIET